MEFLSNNKGALGTIFILIVGFFLYHTFFNTGTLSVELAPDPRETQAADALIKMSNDLAKVSFKQDLFASPGYRMLTDFSTVIPPEPSGRPNPFDQIGRD